MPCPLVGLLPTSQQPAVHRHPASHGAQGAFASVRCTGRCNAHVGGAPAAVRRAPDSSGTSLERRKQTTGCLLVLVPVGSSYQGAPAGMPTERGVISGGGSVGQQRAIAGLVHAAWSCQLLGQPSSGNGTLAPRMVHLWNRSVHALVAPDRPAINLQAAHLCRWGAPRPAAAPLQSPSHARGCSAGPRAIAGLAPPPGISGSVARRSGGEAPSAELPLPLCRRRSCLLPPFHPPSASQAHV